jgi:hypothetical protein
MQKPNIPKCACEWTINVRENRMSNHEWTIQRNWQHWVHKTQDENKRNKKNTIQYVLDTNIGKKTQIT